MIQLIEKKKLSEYKIPTRVCNIRMWLLNEEVKSIVKREGFNNPNTLLGYSESSHYVFFRLPNDNVIRIHGNI